MGRKVAAENVLIIATVLVSVGFGLLSSLPVGHTFPKAAYGYEVLTGLGLGLASPPFYMLLSTSVPEKDIAMGTGALNMLRTLGGTVAVAVCSALLHSNLSQQLRGFLAPEQAQAVEDSTYAISLLPTDLKLKVGEVFGRSYNRQFRVLLAFTCLNFVVAISLGVVRKRKGIFGVIPTRREENEFLKVKGDNTAGNTEAKDESTREGKDKEKKMANVSSADKGKEGEEVDNITATSNDRKDGRVDIPDDDANV